MTSTTGLTSKVYLADFTEFIACARTVSKTKLCSHLCKA